MDIMTFNKLKKDGHVQLTHKHHIKVGRSSFELFEKYDGVETYLKAFFRFDKAFDYACALVNEEQQKEKK